MITVVDEFSRFSVYISLRGLVIDYLPSIFNLFEIPTCPLTVQLFLSKELTKFINTEGVFRSRSTIYNARWDGLVECYNGIIWRTISRALLEVSSGLHVGDDTPPVPSSQVEHAVYRC